MAKSARGEPKSREKNETCGEGCKVLIFVLVCYTERSGGTLRGCIAVVLGFAGSFQVGLATTLSHLSLPYRFALNGRSPPERMCF